MSKFYEIFGMITFWIATAVFALWLLVRFIYSKWFTEFKYRMWPYQIYERYFRFPRLYREWTASNYAEINWNVVEYQYNAYSGKNKKAHNGFRRNIFRKYYAKVFAKMMDSQQYRNYKNPNRYQQQAV